jgi:hypothetical protein
VKKVFFCIPNFATVVAKSFNNDSNGIPFISVFESFNDFEKDKKPFRSVKNVKKRLRTIYQWDNA